MAKKRRISKQAWIDAVTKCAGVVRDVAAALKMHRTTVFRYRQKYPEIDQLFHDVTEVNLDFAESVVHKTMRSRNAKLSFQSASWYLDRKGQKRGYGKQIKLEGDLNQTGQVHLFLPDNGRDGPVDHDKQDSEDSRSINEDSQSTEH